MEKEIRQFAVELKPHNKWIQLILVILTIAIVIYAISIIVAPEGASESTEAIGGAFSALFGLLMLLVFCYICFEVCGSGKQQQQQQQQQQVVVTSGGERKRVCPECGMQNDVTSKFCSDCGYEFAKRKNAKKKK